MHQTHHDFPIRKHLHGIPFIQTNSPDTSIAIQIQQLSIHSYLNLGFVRFFTGYRRLVYYSVRYFMITYHAIILTNNFQGNLSFEFLCSCWIMILYNNYTILLNHIEFNRRVLFPFVFLAFIRFRRNKIPFLY